MKESITKCLEQIRSIFNLYIVTLGLCLIYAVINYVDKEPHELKIFDIKVQPYYFSLVYGILFGLFVIVLYFQLRWFETLIDYTFTGNQATAKSSGDDERRALKTLIRFAPWHLSPFSSKYNNKLISPFQVPIALGVLWLLILAYGHLSANWGDKNLTGIVPIKIDLLKYKYFIGCVDLVVFVLSIILVTLSFISIRRINGTIDKS